MPWNGVPVPSAKVPILTDGRIAPVTGLRANTVRARARISRQTMRRDQRRLLRRVIQCVVEVDQIGVFAVGRLDVVEAQPVIDRETPRDFPVVLHEPFDIAVARVAVQFVVRFGVGVDHTNQRVGERVVRVERVVDVAVEVERAVEGRRARRVARRVFEVESGLQVVIAPDPRDVIGIVPDVVRAEEREALFDVELSRVRKAAEGRVRHEVATDWLPDKTAAASCRA